MSVHSNWGARLGRPAALAVAAALVLSSSGLLAFGDAGHRIVGRAAELHLANSRALTEVRQILRPQETLADAAVWPDTIRNPSYTDGDSEPFRIEHPGNDIYHYTDLPFQATKYDPSVPGAHWLDIVRISRECIKVLRGTSDVFTRREALRLIAHLVGDIHQPLHVGTGYVSTQAPLAFVNPTGPTGWRMTRGGNLLRYGPNDNFNLHSYWDTHIVNLTIQNDDPPTYAARLVKELGVLPTWRNSGDADGWPAAWATEALVLAKEVHAGVKIVADIGPDTERNIPYRWRIEQPAGYDDMAKARTRLQLAKGGYRLAAVLKAIWPDK